ncbi:MAG TPA: PqqD family protein [Pyrinomonadaceae bacterium]|nr:PqqD family protein [Pyrinomonadaceae bacterium]
MKPKSRQENIVMQETNDETLIYDLQTNKAFLLNQTSAFVWNQCDGQKDVQQIAAALARKNQQPINKEIIWLAIDELERNSLLTETAKSASPLHELSRRELVKRVGLTTMMALPVISSLVAPTAANAASVGCVPNASACVISGDSYITSVLTFDDCFRPPAFAACCTCFFSLAGYNSTNGTCTITCR